MQYFNNNIPYIEAKPLNILSDTLEKTEKMQSVILIRLRRIKIHYSKFKKFIAFNMFSSYACPVIKSL